MAVALKFFSNRLCPYSQRAAIVAKEKCVVMEVVDIPLGDEMPQWYKEVNPRETVPTLQVDGKKFVYESDLISRYLDGISSPEESLMGSTPYQRHRVEFFLSQASDLISSYFALIKDPFNPEKRKAVEDNSKYIDDIVSEQQESGPFFLDETFSLADIMLIPFLVRFRPALSYHAAYDIFKNAPHLKKMLSAAMKRPSVKETSLKPEEYVAICKKYVPASHITWSPAPGYVLFSNMKCPFADRVRLACAMKKVDIHLVEVDLRNLPSWYSWVNFRETVPTLLAPDGSYIHESQSIVHYIDEHFSEQGPRLLPKAADMLYSVRFAESNVGHFVSPMYRLLRNPKDKEAKEEVEWAAGELVKQLAEQRCGAGPFFGGATMNAADVCFFPMLARFRACTPELTDGYDLFAKYTQLATYMEAALQTESSKKIILPLEQYLQIYKSIFRPSS